MNNSIIKVLSYFSYLIFVFISNSCINITFCKLLYVVRFVWPGIALVLAPLQTLPAAILSVALGLIVLIIAWHPSVKVAFHLPTESGSSYSIPPELAPQEILDAARIDDTGRRR